METIAKFRDLELNHQEWVLGTFRKRIKLRSSENSLEQLFRLGNPVIAVNVTEGYVRIEWDGSDVFDLLLKNYTT